MTPLIYGVVVVLLYCIYPYIHILTYMNVYTHISHLCIPPKDEDEHITRI